MEGGGGVGAMTMCLLHLLQDALERLRAAGKLTANA